MKLKYTIIPVSTTHIDNYNDDKVSSFANKMMTFLRRKRSVQQKVFIFNYCIKSNPYYL